MDSDLNLVERILSRREDPYDGSLNPETKQDTKIEPPSYKFKKYVGYTIAAAALIGFTALLVYDPPVGESILNFIESIQYK